MRKAYFSPGVGWGVPSAPALALLAACAVALAGCGGKSEAAKEAGSDSTGLPLDDRLHVPLVANRTIAPALGLQVASAAVAVSVPGHRTSEFTVARDPTNPYHLVAAGMDWDSPDGTVQCAAFVSRDGGGSWTAAQALPGHVGTSEDTDPWVAIDAKGVTYLTCTEAGTGLLLGKSLDGGATWQPAQVVPTGGTAAKDALGAFGDGQLYLCYQTSVLHVLISKDGGGAWNDAGFGQIPAGCNGVVQGPGGEVYVVWQGAATIEADRLTPGPPSLGIVLTRDGGAHWEDLTLSSDTGAAPQNLPAAPQSAAPSLAVSSVTGAVFVAAQ
ncbi:MAG: repeat-like domain, partial [Thermoplasmata archaeon]|nr:repeat-like domain [Thermoplasmata archaeon]